MRGSATTWRHGRLWAAGASGVVTLVTLLAGVGLLPTGGPSASASASLSQATPGVTSQPSAVPSTASAAGSDPGSTSSTSSASSAESSSSARSSGPAASAEASDTTVAVPPRSGTGTRVVFDMSDQRVWLVQRGTDGQDDVRRTYLVSGSLTDNLDPGTYAVYSRSRWAVGIGDSGVMQYFVRFTRGDNAAIGFHSIPTKDGRALQTKAQLGTPQSHGCIRQELTDARRLYDFAPEGTTVVVTA
ncbi:MAG: ErfK/YbiS/YcfS/YnhG family protein [Frankiales bacterium]|nr:ErfK/YbiS/YcfS/YnhG family protein [Frankiales bacterium]